MTVPRKHHFIPSTYLSAWTDVGTKEGQLQVVDKSNGKTWPVKPINAAKETDLYMLDVASIEEDIAATEIEDTFAKIEGVAAPVIKQIIAGADMPSGHDCENLMALIATLVVRNPARLNWIDGVMLGPVEAEFQKLVADGKLPLPENEGIAEIIKGLIDKKMFEFTITQNARLAMMASMLDTLFNLLMLRRWTVLRVEPNAGDLVCTDNPVLLLWTKKVPAGYSPGFGMENTAVFVPLGPSTAAIGLWDAEPSDVTLSEDQIVFWNGELLGNIGRFVFSRGEFCALHKNGSVDKRSDVIARWKETTDKR